jgi:hypothetical protein
MISNLKVFLKTYPLLFSFALDVIPISSPWAGNNSLEHSQPQEEKNKAPPAKKKNKKPIRNQDNEFWDNAFDENPGALYAAGLWWLSHKSPEEAFIDFIRAADQGHPASQYEVAMLILNEQVKEKSKEKAIDYLHWAAARNYIEASDKINELEKTSDLDDFVHINVNKPPKGGSKKPYYSLFPGF